MHIFHTQHVQNNFCWSHFVKQLRELDIIIVTQEWTNQWTKNGKKLTNVQTDMKSKIVV